MINQISLDNCVPYFTQIADAITSVINEDYSKYLIVSENKDSSISIKAKSFLAAKIRLQKSAPHIEIRAKYAHIFPENLAKTMSGDLCKLEIADIRDVLLLKVELAILFMTVLSDLGGESFGCCHRYVECSDAKKCTHPDIMTALACSYKKNLDAGRIFYGKNKTI